MMWNFQEMVASSSLPEFSARVLSSLYDAEVQQVHDRGVSSDLVTVDQEFAQLGQRLLALAPDESLSQIQDILKEIL